MKAKKTWSFWWPVLRIAAIFLSRSSRSPTTISEATVEMEISFPSMPIGKLLNQTLAKRKKWKYVYTYVDVRKSKDYECEGNVDV